MEVTLRFCDGWDWRRGRPVGWWTSEDAYEADWEGRPYSVVASDGDTPVAIVDIAWQQAYLAVTTIDAEGRRTSKTVYRRLRDEEMFQVRHQSWHYEAGQRSGDRNVRREKRTSSPDGRYRMEKHSGGLEVHTGRDDGDRFWYPLPDFGELAYLLPGLPIETTEIAEPAGRSRFAAERPWRPPEPMRPSYLDALMTPGTKVHSVSHHAAVTVRHVPVGELSLPTGNVIAADPGWLDAKPEPFEARVEPGSYPVVFVETTEDGEPHVRLGPDAAVILRISGEPVASWAMATTAGQELRLLDDGGFYGFDVDAGMGGFLDKANLPALGKYVHDAWTTASETIAEQGVLTVPGTDANLVGWLCYHGDGSYPVWIGRDAAGRIACFVADMLTVEGEA